MDIEGKFYCSKCMREMNDDNSVCPFCHFDHLNEANKSPALDIGILLNERYQLGAVIGQGGFGITYAAWDETLDIPVAVKEYFPSDFVTRNTEYSDDVVVAENNRKQYLMGMQHFLRESRVLAMMKGLKGVVEVQDYFEENETAYIVMEFIHGISLDKYVELKAVNSKRLLEMMQEPINALISLHKQGVLHRDITPSNFLVQEDGTVKLIDFGSATKMQRDQSIIVVTEQYAPIEQYQSKNSHLGAWTDVYGLAATLYKVLTGITPQESVLRVHKDTLKPIEQTGIKLKSYQSKAIMQGLIVLPEKRTQSMEEFRSRLYNLPLPEEVLARKKFVRKVTGISVVLLLLGLAMIANFTTGLPLGKGLLYSLRYDGWHIIDEIGVEQSLTVPESCMGIHVTAIDEYAFVGNEVLREIQLPDCLEKIDATAFEGASQYLTVWVNEESSAEEAIKQAGLSYDIRADYELEENEDGTVTLVSYNGTKSSVFLPSVIDGKKVTELSEKLGFYISDTVEELILPEHITEIGKNTFDGSTIGALNHNIQKIVLNENLEKIGERAFDESMIQEIVFSENLRVIETGVFASSAVSEMNIPDGVRELGENVFAKSAIKEIILPSSIETLGSGVFANCAQLETVILPDTLSVITESMFRNSDALQHIKIPENVKIIESSAFELCDSLEYLVLPEGVTSIWDKAFADCYSLKYIDIPESVTYIGKDVFSRCSRNLVIGGYEGSAAEAYAIANDIRFDNKSKWIEEVEFTYPGCVDVIWPNYNSDTVFPTYDYVHDTLVHTVDEIAMSQTNVETLRLPLFAEKIGRIAFKESYQLKEIEIFESVQIIDTEAFLACENLEHAYIYGMDTKIDDTAFEACEKLTIHGYTESTAEAYAKEQGIPFEKIE